MTRPIARACRPAARRRWLASKRTRKASPRRAQQAVGAVGGAAPAPQRQAPAAAAPGAPPTATTPAAPAYRRHRCRRGRRCICCAAPAVPIIGPIAVCADRRRSGHRMPAGKRPVTVTPVPLGAEIHDAGPLTRQLKPPSTMWLPQKAAPTGGAYRDSVATRCASYVVFVGQSAFLTCLRTVHAGCNAGTTL
jgi:hypothetical protein